MNTSLYKTEMCRNTLRGNKCAHGDKCVFAHAKHELRPRNRHMRYKTDVCRNYHRHGVCRFGDRCVYIHEKETEKPFVRRSSWVCLSNIWNWSVLVPLPVCVTCE